MIIVVCLILVELVGYCFDWLTFVLGVFSCALFYALMLGFGLSIVGWLVCLVTIVSTVCLLLICLFVCLVTLVVVC